jgi:hypothetical protein
MLQNKTATVTGSITYSIQGISAKHTLTILVTFKLKNPIEEEWTLETSVIDQGSKSTLNSYFSTSQVKGQ